jgi:hypothetical protein
MKPHAIHVRTDPPSSRRTLRALVTLCALLTSTACGDGDVSVQSQFEPPRTMRAQQAGTSAGSAAQVSIDALTLVDSRRAGRSVFDYDYEVTLKNDGAAEDEVFVQLAGVGAGTTVVAGAVLVGAIGAGASVTPPGRITIRHDRTQPFQVDLLAWKIDATVGGLAGTAAAGAAAAFGRVTVSDRNGTSACAQTTIVTPRDGTFACQVLKSSEPPYLLRVVFPSGARRPMFSFRDAAPGPGNSAVVNITTLTTAILRQLAPENDLLALNADPTLIVPAALADLVAKVLTQVAATRTALNLPADYSPFTTPIVAATVDQAGNAPDLLLDLIQIGAVNGQDYIYTLDDPDGAVPLAGPATVTPGVLPAPSADAMQAPEAVRRFIARLYACLQVPNRVVAVDATIPASQGGPKVTAVVDACTGIWADDYLDNGYSWGQRYYDLLTDPRVPDGLTYELLRVIPGTAAAGAGSAGSALRRRASAPRSKTAHTDAPFIVGRPEETYFFRSLSEQDAEYIQRYRELFALSPTALADEWIDHGNQNPVDFTLTPVIIRLEQFAPNPGQSPFINALPNAFMTGTQFLVNPTGPGSDSLARIRIHDPRWPPLQVVLVPVNTNGNQWTIHNKTGDVDPQQIGPASNVGSTLFESRTNDIIGQGATQFLANFFNDSSNPNAARNWVQAVNTGAPPGTLDFPDSGKVAQALDYPIEYYHSAALSPTVTIQRPRTKDRQRAVDLKKSLQWRLLTPDTRGYFDPADPLAGSVDDMTLNLDPNEFACPFLAADLSTVSGDGPFRIGNNFVGEISSNDEIIFGLNSTPAQVPSMLPADGINKRSVRTVILCGGGSDTIQFFTFN